MKYIPTKLTGDLLTKLLSSGTTDVYLILCYLGAHRDGGWTGSCRRVRTHLEKMTGRSQNKKRLSKKIATLVDIGILTIEDGVVFLIQGGTNRTRVQIVPGGGGYESYPGVGTNRPQSGYESYPPTLRIEGVKKETTTTYVDPHTSNIVDVVKTSSTSNIKTSSIKKGREPSSLPSSSFDNILRKISQSPKLRGRVPAKVIEDLLDETTEKEIINQLTWYSYRDSSWAKTPTAALVAYCRQREPIPPALVARKEEERQKRSQGSEETVSLRDFLKNNPETKEVLKGIRKGDSNG